MVFAETHPKTTNATRPPPMQKAENLDLTEYEFARLIEALTTDERAEWATLQSGLAWRHVHKGGGPPPPLLCGPPQPALRAAAPLLACTQRSLGAPLGCLQGGCSQAQAPPSITCNTPPSSHPCTLHPSLVVQPALTNHPPCNGRTPPPSAGVLARVSTELNELLPTTTDLLRAYFGGQLSAKALAGAGAGAAGDRGGETSSAQASTSAPGQAARWQVDTVQVRGACDCVVQRTSALSGQGAG